MRMRKEKGEQGVANTKMQSDGRDVVGDTRNIEKELSDEATSTCGRINHSPCKHPDILRRIKMPVQTPRHVRTSWMEQLHVSINCPPHIWSRRDNHHVHSSSPWVLTTTDRKYAHSS